MRYLAVTLFLFLIYPSGAFAGFIGPVVSILDGDTIEVLNYAQPERVRLSGIDCPEKGHAFGNRAKQAASALVFGADVIFQFRLLVEVSGSRLGRETAETTLLPLKIETNGSHIC